jgi:hypothetical protein
LKFYEQHNAVGPANKAHEAPAKEAENFDQHDRWKCSATE